MRLFKTRLFAASFLIFINAKAQSTFDPNISLENISITQWTADDGLTSNNTTAVYLDSQNLIWVTSFNGFMIYDGERIEVYDVNNLEFLETDGFYCLTEDDSGTVYLGSQGSGIVRYQAGKFSPLEIVGENLPRSVKSLMVAKNGALYVGTNINGLYRYNVDSKVERISHPILDHVTVMSMIEDKNGAIWAATENDGIFKYDMDKVIQITEDDGLLMNNVKFLNVDHEGNLLIGTPIGLQILDKEGAFSTVGGLEGVYVNCVIVDEWNSIWAGTEDGVARWNERSQRLDWIYSRRGIDLVRISSLIQDKEGNIWLTSSRSGLVRIKESIVTNISEPTLSSNRVNIIYEGPDEKLYVGTDQNHMDVCDDGTCEIIKISTNLRGNGIRDIFLDDDGSIWLATYVGIIHKTGNREIVYSIADGMPAENFRKVIKDRTGNYWFGSRSGGLVKFRNGQIQKVYKNGQGLESNFILSLEEAPNGDIYVGTHSGGLSIINQNDEIKTYHLKADDSGILLFNIDIDENNDAKIIANIGPIVFENDKLTQVHLAADKRSKTYFDIITDLRNHYWVTTNLGIIQINKEDWGRYKNGIIQEIPYVLIDENDGMLNRECTGATASTIAKSGAIHVPTLGGICTIRPDQLVENVGTPDVIIRHVYSDNKEQKLGVERTILGPGVRRYSFEFAVLSYTAPERNQFKYKLEGFDKDWNNITNDGEVEYTNLPPGNYTFKVIGSSDGKLWNNEGDSFSFRVKPFFYQTIWLYVLILMVLSMIFYLIYRWRVSFIDRQNMELKKVNEELDRFVYSASHELRSPLSSILGLVNVARHDDKSDKNEYLDHIESSVVRLDAFIHDIIDYSRNARLGLNVGLVDFDDMVQGIVDDISYTPNFEKVDFVYDNDYGPDFQTDNKRLKVVMSNIITNAFKHHAPENVTDPFVQVNIENENGGVKILISDNGPGIDKKHRKNVFKMFYRATNRSEGSGLGLYIVQETISKLQGKIEIRSQEQSGTTFSIYLPNLKTI